jgi:hypothetical protein
MLPSRTQDPFHRRHARDSRTAGWSASALLLLGASLTVTACSDDKPVANDHDADDSSSTDDEPPVNDEEWELVAEDLPGALFSVWGSSEDDVWVVGADSGSGPAVLHYDGDEWRTLDTGQSGDLWWVSGKGDSVWMSGSEGLVLRYSVSDEEFEVFQMPDPVTVFGIFPVAEDDVWAVGGDFFGDVSRAVYRFDGDQWGAVTGVPEEPDTGNPPLFKVWGRSSEDLWIVGFGTQALHRDGDEWVSIPIPTERRLFTVHGSDDYVAAVGGSISGLLVEEQNGEFVDTTPDAMPQMNGIWVRPDGDAIAAGNGGSIYARRDGDWEEVLEPPLTAWDYHAVFVDRAGGEWAVGGQVIAPPYTNGMLAHRGRGLRTDGLGD